VQVGLGDVAANEQTAPEHRADAAQDDAQLNTTSSTVVMGSDIASSSTAMPSHLKRSHTNSRSRSIPLRPTLATRRTRQQCRGCPCCQQPSRARHRRRGVRENHQTCSPNPSI
jgi:hypothetical protein